MGTVGIKELKNRLTEYLRRTKHGEEVVVTERGRPIALIRPIRAGEPTASRDAKLAGLAARGLVALPRRKLVKRVRHVKIRGAPLSRTIIEDRR